MSSAVEEHVRVGSNELEIIEFYMHQEGESADGQHPANYFGVNVAKVLEVIEMPDIVAPESPPHPSFLGAVPLRGSVLPLLDLSRCLDMHRREVEHEVILVMEFYGKIMGFLVSGVTRIYRINWQDVQPPSNYIGNFPGNCVTGMVRMEDRFTLLLDFERLISDIDETFLDKPNAGMAGLEGDRRYSALISEDSTAIRGLVKQKLEEANFDIRTARNGQDAWDQLLALKARARDQDVPIQEFVDIVVTDVEMPSMDGFTLCRNIKDDPDLSALPVILFSSLISERNQHKGELAGADDQIPKPEFNQLARRAIRLIEGGPGAAVADVAEAVVEAAGADAAETAAEAG